MPAAMVGESSYWSKRKGSFKANSFEESTISTLRFEHSQSQYLSLGISWSPSIQENNLTGFVETQRMCLFEAFSSWVQWSYLVEVAKRWLFWVCLFISLLRVLPWLWTWEWFLFVLEAVSLHLTSKQLSCLWKRDFSDHRSKITS